MPELIRIVGTDVNKGITRDLWPEDQQIIAAVFQKDAAAEEDVINLAQQIQELGRRHLGQGLATDGLMTGGSIVILQGDANAFYFNKSFILLDHLPYIVADSRNTNPGIGTNQAVHVILDGPPTGLPRTDLVFLELWYQEMAGAGATNADTILYERGGQGNAINPEGNTILDPYTNMEWSRRVQANWRIRIVDGASSVAGQPAWGSTSGPVGALTYSLVAGSQSLYRAGGLSANPVHSQGTLTDATNLGTVNGFSYAFPLFTINRRPGVTQLALSDFLTTQPVSQLNIQVPIANINPPLPYPLPGADVFPVTFLYDGLLGASTTGNGTTEYAINSSTLSTKFIVPQPVGVTVTSTILSRVDLQLARRGAVGSGSDITVQVVADAAGPNGSVLSSFTMPKEWLLNTSRLISLPFNMVMQYGVTYWIRVVQAGDANNYTAWIGEDPSSASTPNSLSGTAPIPNLHMSVFVEPAPGQTGTAAVTGYDQVRNTIEGNSILFSELEYDANSGSLVYEADVTFSQTTGTILEASLVQVISDQTSGAITALNEINAR